MGTALNFAAALKQIQAKINYGRTDNVEEKLEDLLREYEHTDSEVPILQIYASEYQGKLADYKRAIPVLKKRLLSLNITDETRATASSWLAHHKTRAAIVPSDVSQEPAHGETCLT
jgi:hypothetical protein